MIQLYLDGQPAALFPDTKIGITAMNPYFNEMEAYSYPFTIPYKPNERILRHPARIQNVNNYFIYDAVLVVDGVQILKGEAVADGDVIDEEFPIVLRSAKTSFTKLAETKKMSDLAWGIEDNALLSSEQVTANRSITLGQTYPTAKYVCAPFYDAEAWTEQEGKFLNPNYINQYDPATEKLLQNPSQGITNVITYNFYVRWILKRIIEIFGYSLQTDEMATISDLNKWFLLSLNNMWDYQNVYYPFAFPEITVREFLKTIRQFGIVVVIDERKKEASIRLVKNIFTAPVVNSTLSDKALKETLVMSTPIDGYTVEYGDTEDDLLLQPVSDTYEEVANYAALPSPEYATLYYMYKTTSTDKYWVSVLQKKENESDPDVFLWKERGLFRPYISGNGAEKITIETTMLPQRREMVSVTKTQHILIENGSIDVTKTWDIEIEMPITTMKMNQFYSGCGYFGEKYEDFKLVFLFNWGLKTYACPADTRVIVKFPVISQDSFDIAEVSKGALSMRTSGSTGIIEQLVKAEQEWIIRRKTKRQGFILSVADYVNFSWPSVYNISRVNYIVNSLKFDISSAGLSVVEAELFTF